MNEGKEGATSEEVLGRLYFDLITSRCRVANHFLNAEDVINFLDGRYKATSNFNSTIHARPSDMLSVVLILGSALRLDEAFDGSLILMDGEHINMFIPDDPKDYGIVGPIRGVNISKTVGRGIWRCIDIRREIFGGDFLELLSCAASDDAHLAACLRASITLRDRVPWLSIGSLFRGLAPQQFTEVRIIPSREGHS